MSQSAALAYIVSGNDDKADWLVDFINSLIARLRAMDCADLSGDAEHLKIVDRCEALIKRLEQARGHAELAAQIVQSVIAEMPD
jgi:hypothetical protein